jgi:uncharacterized membrane protein YtjA (UPF0391 family)
MEWAGYNRGGMPGDAAGAAGNAMKIVLVVLLLLVLVSLFSGLYFMYRDKGQSKRTVTALTIRVGLSILIFVLIIVGGYLGWWGPSR